MNRAMSLMAHHADSRQCSTAVAFGAKRTLTEPRLQNANLRVHALIRCGLVLVRSIRNRMLCQFCQSSPQGLSGDDASVPTRWFFADGHL
jgi:hypothetical protein